MLFSSALLVDADIDYWFHEPAELFAILDEHLSGSSKKGRGDAARLDEILYSLYSDIFALLQVLSMIRFRQLRVSVRTLQEAKKIGIAKLGDVQEPASWIKTRP